jgi:hypothetical protein
VPVPTPVPPTARPKPPPSQSLKPGQTPRGSPLNIGALMTARISVLALGDLPIDVTVDVFDPSNGNTNLAKFTLHTLDSDAEPMLPGNYVISFKRQGESKAATCTIKVVAGDSYRFVTTDLVAVVSRKGSPPKTAADQLIESAPACHPVF